MNIDLEAQFKKVIDFVKLHFMWLLPLLFFVTPYGRKMVKNMFGSARKASGGTSAKLRKLKARLRKMKFRKRYAY